jgi:hypothetical protein
MLHRKIAIILLCSSVFHAPSWAEQSTEQPPTESLENRVLYLEQSVNELKQELQQIHLQLRQSSFVSGDSNAAAVVGDLQLKLESWQFREVKIKFNTHYALDLVLSNGYDKAIKDIDARVNFRNLLGGHLYSIAVTEHLRIPPQEQATDEGTQRNNRLLGQRHPMLTLKNDEITTELIIRKIVFEDNSLLSF